MWRRECVAVHDVDVSHCFSLPIHSLVLLSASFHVRLGTHFARFFCQIRLLLLPSGLKINLTTEDVNRVQGRGKRVSRSSDTQEGDREEMMCRPQSAGRRLRSLLSCCSRSLIHVSPTDDLLPIISHLWTVRLTSACHAAAAAVTALPFRLTSRFCFLFKRLCFLPNKLLLQV